MRNVFQQGSPKNKCVLVELDMKRWQVQGERQPSWGMMGRWTEEVRLPPLGLDSSFSLPSSSWLFTTCASPWSRQSPGWLSAVPAERGREMNLHGTAPFHAELRQVVVSFGPIKVFLIYFCLWNNSLANYVVSSDFQTCWDFAWTILS